MADEELTTIRIYKQGGTTLLAVKSTHGTIAYIRVIHTSVGNKQRVQFYDEDKQSLDYVDFVGERTVGDQQLYGLANIKNSRISQYDLMPGATAPYYRVDWSGNHSLFLVYNDKEPTLDTEFKITLYKNPYNPNKLDKNLSNLAHYEITGRLTNQGTSVLNPVISVESGWNSTDFNLIDYNYCAIPVFHRTYFITDIELPKVNGLWILHLKVDPLTSYKSIIDNSTIWVKRSSAGYNNRIYDPTLPVQDNPTVKKYNVSSVTNNYFKVASAGTPCIVCCISCTAKGYGGGGTTETTANYGTHSVALGAIRPFGSTDNIFVLTPIQYHALVDALQAWTDYIPCLKWAIALPMNVADFYSLSSVTGITLRKGDGIISAGSKPYPDFQGYKLSGYSLMSPREMGYFSIGSVNDVMTKGAFDTDNYCTWVLHLPFASSIQLKYSDFASAKRISVYCTVDIFTGAIRYHIKADSDIISVVDTCVGSFLSVSGQNQTAMFNSALMGIAGATITTIAGIATENPAIAVGGIASGVNSAVQYDSNLSGGGGVTANGSIASWGDPHMPFIIKKKFPALTSTTHNTIMGRICEKGGAVSSFSGIIWGNIKLSQSSSYTLYKHITDTEREQIKNIFMNGVEL